MKWCISFLFFILMGCTFNRDLGILQSDGFYFDKNEVMGVETYTDRAFISDMRTDLSSSFGYSSDVYADVRKVYTDTSDSYSFLLHFKYQQSDWIYLKAVTLLNNKGERLSLDYGTRTSEVISGGCYNGYCIDPTCREFYTIILTKNDARNLVSVLNADSVFVGFVGSSIYTDKYYLDPEYQRAIFRTLYKWQKITGNIIMEFK